MEDAQDNRVGAWGVCTGFYMKIPMDHFRFGREQFHLNRSCGAYILWPVEGLFNNSIWGLLGGGKWGIPTKLVGIPKPLDFVEEAQDNRGCMGGISY